MATLIGKQTLREWCLDKSGANQFKYMEAIGSLEYVAMISRPDISYTTGKVAWYAENPSLEYSTGVKRVLQYLYGTVTIPLCLYNDDSQTGLFSYSDSEYIWDNKTAGPQDGPS